MPEQNNENSEQFEAKCQALAELLIEAIENEGSKSHEVEPGFRSNREGL